MQNIQPTLTAHKELINSHVSQLASFMGNSKVVNVCFEYQETKEDRFELGFNVFKLTSDRYYRENYHSDIIKAFLNPIENHGQGNVFLYAFIDMLNRSFCDKVKVRKKNYLNASARREDGKLDILILSEESKHCIIIENKIHNAGDMPRQLPRYYDYMTNRGFIVDAIVYLPLEQTKTPDTTDWNQEDKDHVLPILCHLPAYTKDGTPNLVENWIKPCSTLTNDIDCHSILRQYGNLVKSLNINIMDKIITSKFYDTLLEGDNLESALSIKAMLDDVPVVMADRLYQRLQSLNPFGNVWNGYKPNFCGLIFKVDGREYKIDTYSTLDGYEVYLFPNESDHTMDIPWAETLEVIRNGNRLGSGEYFFKFPFKHETETVNFITELINAAKTYDHDTKQD